jgi:hypothetical protein
MNGVRVSHSRESEGFHRRPTGRQSRPPTANHATDRATDGPAYGTAFVCAAFRAGGNSLSLHRERRSKQSRDHGYSEFFLHHGFSLSSVAGLNIGLRQKFLRRGGVKTASLAVGPSGRGGNAARARGITPVLAKFL